MQDSTLHGVTMHVGGSPNPDVGIGSTELTAPRRDDVFRALDEVGERQRLDVTLEARAERGRLITVSHPRRAFTLECHQCTTEPILWASSTDKDRVRDVLASWAAGNDEWRTMLDWHAADDDTALRPASWWQRLLGVRWVPDRDPRPSTERDEP